MNTVDQAKERVRRAIAEGIARAAVYFFNQHRQRLSVSSPHTGRHYTNPSHRGEYPKLRTGEGRDSTWWDPRSVSEIIAGGLKTRIGYKRTLSHPVGNHLLALEHKGWLGLEKTLETTRPQLARLVGEGFKAGMSRT